MEIAEELALCERELDARSLRLWERIRIAATRWKQSQYPGQESFWVVAILGYRCLYFNNIEGGWGWGRFSEWGCIAEYHCQQDELHQVVMQTLFAIDQGGTG